MVKILTAHRQPVTAFSYIWLLSVSNGSLIDPDSAWVTSSMLFSPTLIKTSSIVVTEIPKPDIPSCFLLAIRNLKLVGLPAKQTKCIPSSVSKSVGNLEAIVLGSIKDNSAPTLLVCKH